jgi:hypothetical protein
MAKVFATKKKNSFTFWEDKGYPVYFSLGLYLPGSAFFKVLLPLLSVSNCQFFTFT